MRRLGVPALAVLMAVGMLACAGPAPTPTATPAPSAPPSATPGAASASPSVDLERAATELDILLSTLENTHPEPFHAIERSTFVAALEDYRDRLPSLGRDEAAVELMRVWAMLSREGRDGHEFALPLDPASDLVLPIRVYEFTEGLFVTDAAPPHEAIVGGRVTHVGEHPIDDVLDAVEPLVPRDGPATVPAFRPVFLLRAVVLHGLGLTGEGPIEVTVEMPDGGERREALEPITAEEHAAWAGPFGLLRLPEADESAVDGAEALTVTTEGSTLVLDYPQVSAPDMQPARDAIASGSVERLVLDLRQNPGGNNQTYGPLLELVRAWAAEHPGATTVLIDRVTFSAASNLATQIEQSTDAVFIGEPMGGAPNFWNDVTWVPLRSLPTPMNVGLSTTHWEFSTPDDPRLTIEPDRLVPVTAADHFAGRDPVMEAALAP